MKTKSQRALEITILYACLVSFFSQKTQNGYAPITAAQYIAEKQIKIKKSVGPRKFGFGPNHLFPFNKINPIKPV